MEPDNVGQWAIICKTTDHYIAGMQAKYDVKKCGTSDNADVKGKTRKYYIAAVERDWDYAPTGKDVLEGKSLENSEYVVKKGKKTLQYNTKNNKL
jgi:hypothetical protein